MVGEVEHTHALRALRVEVQDGADTTHLTNRRPVTNLRFGALLRASEKLEIGWGAYTDRSPRRSTAPGEVDVNYAGITGGIRLTQPVALAAREREHELRFRSTFAARYGLGLGRASQIRATVDGTEDLNLEFERDVDVTFHELHLIIATGIQF